MTKPKDWFPWPSTEPKEHEKLRDISEGLKEGCEVARELYNECTNEERKKVAIIFNNGEMG